MARTYTEGYRIGFITGRKDISKKKTVNIRYQLGFERMVKSAIVQFEEMGLRKTVIYRHALRRQSTEETSSETDLQAALPIRSLTMITDRTAHCLWIPTL